MIRRNPFDAASNAAAVQRSAIDPLCQFFTRRIRSRAAECPLSMMFVVPRQRRSALGRPNLLIVNISPSPSRKDAAAAGHSCSSHVAYCSSFAVPSFASSLNAARSVALACSCWSSGRWPTTLRILCTIRAQSTIRGFRTRAARHDAAERDHVTDLQRLLPHDHALDQQLQDRLLLLQARPVQAAADSLAESSEVAQDPLGMGRPSDQPQLLLVLLIKDEAALGKSATALIQFLQADDRRLIRVDQPFGFAIQSPELSM